MVLKHEGIARAASTLDSTQVVERCAVTARIVALAGFAVVAGLSGACGGIDPESEYADDSDALREEPSFQTVASYPMELGSTCFNATDTQQVYIVDVIGDRRAYWRNGTKCTRVLPAPGHFLGQLSLPGS